MAFEITETAAIANLSAAVNFISALKDLGYHFALDDFGAGFGSFIYLKHLPVDRLKIDGSFVQGLANGLVDQAMVQSMNHGGFLIEMVRAMCGIKESHIMMFEKRNQCHTCHESANMCTPGHATLTIRCHQRIENLQHKPET